MCIVWLVLFSRLKTGMIVYFEFHKISVNILGSDIELNCIIVVNGVVMYTKNNLIDKLNCKLQTY